MRIGIIGKGRVGSALCSGWTKAGHEVQMAGRADLAKVAAWAEVIALAVPYAAVQEIAHSIAPAIGKTVIDCTNPIAMGPDGLGLAVGHESSGAEQLQSRLPQAHVVKSLNQVGAEIMADTSGFAQPPLQFLAGDNAAAKDAVRALLSDLGFEALDAGGLSKARLLEPFALVWINQAIARKKGRDWAFGAMPRGGAA